MLPLKSLINPPTSEHASSFVGPNADLCVQQVSGGVGWPFRHSEPSLATCLSVAPCVWRFFAASSGGAPNRKIDLSSLPLELQIWTSRRRASKRARRPPTREALDADRRGLSYAHRISAIFCRGNFEAGLQGHVGRHRRLPRCVLRAPRRQARQLLVGGLGAQFHREAR